MVSRLYTALTVTGQMVAAKCRDNSIKGYCLCTGRQATWWLLKTVTILDLNSVMKREASEGGQDNEHKRD